MKFIDLINDAKDSTHLGDDFNVFLATRMVDGVEMPPGEARLLNIGMLRIDRNEEEIGLIMAERIGEAEDTFTTFAAERMLAENPEIADFELISLKEHQVTEDGQPCEVVCQIGGSLTRRNQIWLLLLPVHQWRSMGLHVPED